MSALLAPGGTIGQTLASGSITKSMTTGPGGRLGHADSGEDFVVPGHSDPGRAIRFREFDEIGSVNLDLRVVLLVEEVLPLPDHPEIAVVDDGNPDIEFFLDAGGEFVQRHLEATIADDRPDLQIGSTDLCPDRRWQPVAHGAKTTGCQPAIRMVEPEMLSGPHLVLSNVSGIDRFAIRRFGNRSNDGVGLWPLGSIFKRGFERHIAL